LATDHPRGLDLLKTRLIPTLQVKNWGLVKSHQFSSWRPIGPPVVAGRVYNARRVDELVVLDIDAPREGRSPNVPLLRDIADVCFMPLTTGGGVRSTDDVRRLLHSGADKVALNTALADAPGVVEECASDFGVQCIVGSIDARRTDGGHEAYVEAGTRGTGASAVELARRAETLGAGEILLTSIDQDGTMEGYDLGLIEAVSSAVTVPVIACGGAGTLEHFASAVIDAGADAVSAASIFHFTRFTPNDVKAHMREAGLDVRL
jgi:imidazole glycerol-phosphate synthase subunit HisF